MNDIVRSRDVIHNLFNHEETKRYFTQFECGGIIIRVNMYIHERVSLLHMKCLVGETYKLSSR